MGYRNPFEEKRDRDGWKRYLLGQVGFWEEGIGKQAERCLRPNGYEDRQYGIDVVLFVFAAQQMREAAIQAVRRLSIGGDALEDFDSAHPHLKSLRDLLAHSLSPRSDSESMTGLQIQPGKVVNVEDDRTITTVLNVVKCGDDARILAGKLRPQIQAA
jgi:hypothetical protein